MPCAAPDCRCIVEMVALQLSIHILLVCRAWQTFSGCAFVLSGLPEAGPFFYNTWAPARHEELAAFTVACIVQSSQSQLCKAWDHRLNFLSITGPGLQELCGVSTVVSTVYGTSRHVTSNACRGLKKQYAIYALSSSVRLMILSLN